MGVPPLAEEELQVLYTWVDGIPLSRPKRNISRDFSDAVLLAEVVHHFFPKMVELHNYRCVQRSLQPVRVCVVALRRAAVGAVAAPLVVVVVVVVVVVEVVKSGI